MNRRILLMEDWVFDDKNAFMGSEVATASFVSKGNENKLYAASVREIFDRKEGVKHLPFFISGKVSEELLNSWIAT